MFTFECRPIGRNLCPLFVHLLHGIGHPERLASGRDRQLALDCRSGGGGSGQTASPPPPSAPAPGGLCPSQRATRARTPLPRASRGGPPNRAPPPPRHPPHDS